MNLSDLGKTVAKYAPLLGAVLPIPGGAAIGAAIASAFDGDISKTDDLIKRINADPNAALKLAEIQSQERIEIERLAVERLRIDSDNTVNARNREIEVSKIPEAQRDRTPAIIATVFISGYFLVTIFIIVLIWTKTIDANETQPVVELLKDLGYALMLILSYYYGASNSRQS